MKPPGCGIMGHSIDERPTEQRERAGERTRYEPQPDRRLHPGGGGPHLRHLFGQEVNPETFAICKSDLFMKSDDGRDADNVVFGSTLSNDRHAGAAFDYMIANPPYGKDWKRDQDAVRDEHDRGAAGRFGPGLPRISKGDRCRGEAGHEVRGRRAAVTGDRPAASRERWRDF